MHEIKAIVYCLAKIFAWQQINIDFDTWHKSDCLLFSEDICVATNYHLTMLWQRRVSVKAKGINIRALGHDYNHSCGRMLSLSAFAQLSSCTTIDTFELMFIMTSQMLTWWIGYRDFQVRAKSVVLLIHPFSSRLVFTDVPWFSPAACL